MSPLLRGVTRLGLALMEHMARWPLPVLRALGVVIGLVLYVLVPSRRHIVQSNLALCFPELSRRERHRMARRSFVCFAQTWLDRSWLWHAPREVLERRLSRAGKVPSLEVALALIVLMLVSFALPASLRSDVLFAGLIGLVLQILSTSLADFFGGEEAAVGRMAAQSGFASLIYLELLDASFSLDGTIGAFAITSDLGLILTGLGLGALFIRSLTVMLSREKALDNLIYLEHGAHYAIGALGLLMLSGVVIGRWDWHVPEWLSGLIGVVLLLLALGDSLRHKRRRDQAAESAVM